MHSSLDLTRALVADRQGRVQRDVEGLRLLRTARQARRARRAGRGGPVAGVTALPAGVGDPARVAAGPADRAA